MADAQILAAGQSSSPLDYTVPNAQEIVLNAVRAVFDGTGAAGNFLPCVTVVSDGGFEVASAIGSVVAAGGSADASFFPGVGVGAGGGTTSPDLPWGMARRDALTVATGAGFTSVDFDTTVGTVSFGSSGDGIVSITVDGTGTHCLTLNAAGLYLVSWHAQGFTNAAPAVNATLEADCDFDTGDYVAGALQGAPTLTSVGPQSILEAGESMILDLDATNYPIPNTGRLKVRQNTGNNLTVYSVVQAVRLSTITDPNIF